MRIPYWLYRWFGRRPFPERFYRVECEHIWTDSDPQLLTLDLARCRKCGKTVLTAAAQQQEELLKLARQLRRWAEANRRQAHTGPNKQLASALAVEQANYAAQIRRIARMTP